MAKQPKKLYRYRGEVKRLWDDGVVTYIRYTNEGKPIITWVDEYCWAVSKKQFKMLIKRRIAKLPEVNLKVREVLLNEKYCYIKKEV